MIYNEHNHGVEEHDGIPSHNGVKFIHIIHPKVEGVLIKIF